MGLDTSSLEDRIAAFDNICLWGGFPIKQPINRMLIYVSEPALHHSCCHSSKQDDSASSGTWHGWVTRKTCLEPYITSIRRLFKDWRRRPGRASSPWVARESTYLGLWTPRTSTSHLATDSGSRPSAAQPLTEFNMATCPEYRGGWRQLVETATLQPGAFPQWWWWWWGVDCQSLI